MKLPDTKSIRRWLILRADGEVLNCHLNFPEKHNALSPDLIRALTEFFSTRFLEIGIRAIVLRGEGPSFCAGADLNYMKSMVNFTMEENIADAENLFFMLESVTKCEVPVLGIAHGYIYGGGIGLLAACDIALAVEDSQFCFSEAKLGLAPAIISPFVLRRMSYSAIRRYFLTAEVFSAKEALTFGLLNAIGSREELEDLKSKILQNILAAGPKAQKTIKELLNQNLEEKKEYLSRLIAQLRISEEGQEGMRAFFEKRKPSWQKPLLP